MKIGCIGSGYVGLVSAVMFAHLEHEVICLDKDISKIDALSKGKCVIYEKDLEKYLIAALKNCKITFTASYSDLSGCEAVFICVGTPSLEDGSADLSQVENSIKELVEHVSDECLIVIKSSVPPLSANKMQEMLYAHGFRNLIASNPEFLREGTAVHDFMNPDRLVFGGQASAHEILNAIHKRIIETGAEVVTTDTITSEMIKYCSNSFLATKLSFINEMSDICEKIGADPVILSKGMGLDKRIGPLFLRIGPGYGGSCFPKDTLALKDLATKVGASSKVLNAAINSNLSRYKLMSDKITDICSGLKTLAIFGTAFKGGTDDIRESPSVHIINLLVKEGFTLKIYDPAANENFKLLKIDNAYTYDSPEDAAKDSSAIIILTDWDVFASLNFDRIGSNMKNRILIDLRRVADTQRAKQAGFKIFLVGDKE
ncbi:MAG: UDP-glucose/GDP-mannose dehydrogenase family protein [Rickettsiaceae bacterium]|nr:UDP-glucose/GDP-mannose dehydrogenase family protein [Rickettsiaceae bacterium]